jgi:molybdenum cofactor biosynthesis enzyme MoaA
MMVIKDGGMSINVRSNDFYSCPPWVDIDSWARYRQRYNNASFGEHDFIQLDLELSDSCNYKCIECPISNKSPKSYNSLSITDAQKIIVDAAECGVQCLKLNYINEPLLNAQKIIDLSIYAKQAGIIDIYFTTNGSLLTEGIAEEIIKAESITRIQVSLDAYTQDI